MPKDVVVVVPCPECHELVVLFRKRAIPLSRRIIEEGSFEERKAHLATVIAEFLEAGMLSMNGAQADTEAEGLPEGGAEGELAPLDFEGPMSQISDKEMEKFVRIDLKCIDNDAYFNRHFRA